MSAFFDLTVEDVKRETPDCVSVAFTIPEEHAEQFSYLPGQYLTLAPEIDGKEERRSYSLCSSPDNNEAHRIAVKKVEGGLVSTLLNDTLKKGDRLKVMAPAGQFTTALSADQDKQYVFFAAGSGITPVISIIKSILIREKKSKAMLFYGNRDEEHVIFKEELTELTAKHGDRFQVVHRLSKPTGAKGLFKKKLAFGEKGRLDRKTSLKLIKNHIGASASSAEYFICGPSGMMKEVGLALEEKKVASAQIHREYFVSPEEEAAMKKNKAETASGEGSSVSVTLDGKETTIQVKSGTTILDAASKAGLDAPYSCRGAVCATCMAKLLEGEVEMEMNYVLTDKEIEDGFIVTCQSHPKTPTVKITYDDLL